MAYATLADLQTYTGEDTTAPGDELLLQRASDLLDSVLSTAFYVVDSTGTATDVRVTAALLTATCAQVEFWRATNDSLGAQGQYTRAPGATVRGAGNQGTAGVGLRRLAPRAREALMSAGIWRHKPLAW